MLQSKALAIGLSAGLACAFLPSPLHADDTGLASMHAWQKVGRKTCLLDHYHSGEGEGRNKRAARNAAISDWESFTAFEYGAVWARFRSAASRGVRYEKTAEGWLASVEARPCRRRSRR
jgi:hypothetical protein